MKRLQITPEIEARLKNSVGSVPTNVAVFECIAINTLPVRKRGSIYDKSTLAATTIQQMAAFLQGAGNFVPLHTRHAQGYEMPVGRVFYGEMFSNDAGQVELRTQFFVDLSDAEGTTFAGKIDNGTIDEVSINLLPKHLNCSECGYDFIDQDNMKSNPYALWDRTCPNDHTIGQDGVHAIVNGMDRWYELSLVSLGAANGAKILGPGATKLNMGDEDRQRLAASGVQPEAIVLTASTPQPKEKPEMPGENDTKVTGIPVDQFIDVSNKLTLANHELTQKTARVTELEAQLGELPGLREKAGKFDAAQQSLTETQDWVKEQAKKAAVALGLGEAAVPATFAEQTKFIEECGVKLHALIPVNGVTTGADADKGKTQVPSRAASFSTKR